MKKSHLETGWAIEDEVNKEEEGGEKWEKFYVMCDRPFKSESAAFVWRVSPMFVRTLCNFVIFEWSDRKYAVSVGNPCDFRWKKMSASHSHL